MSTSLSAHNACISMFQSDRQWNVWEDKKKRNQARFYAPPAPKANTSRLPKLRVEFREKDFVALALESKRSETAKKGTNSGSPAEASTVPFDIQQEAPDGSVPMLLRPLDETGRDLEPHEEWVVLSVMGNMDGDDFVVLGSHSFDDEMDDWVDGSDTDETPVPVVLSYARAASLALAWGVSGENISKNKSASWKSGHEEKEEGGNEKAECYEDNGLSSFAEQWHEAKSYGENLYQRKKADKAKRKARLEQ